MPSVRALFTASRTVPDAVRYLIPLIQNKLEIRCMSENTGMLVLMTKEGKSTLLAPRALGLGLRATQQVRRHLLDFLALPSGRFRIG